MLQRREGLVELGKMVGECVLGVNVKGSAVLFHERIDGDSLAIQLPAHIMEIMHRGLIWRNPGRGAKKK
jgi:hypothetical protein